MKKSSKTIVLNTKEHEIWLQLQVENSSSTINLTRDELKIIDRYGHITNIPIDILKESLSLLKRKQQEGLQIQSQEISEMTIRA